MEPEQAEEWKAFKKAAVERLRAGSSLETRGARRLLLLLRLPTFDPGTAWEVFRDTGSEPCSYFVARTIWRMDLDVRKFESPVARLKHPRELAPTLETSRASLDSPEVEALLQRLCDLRLPPLCADAAMGLDVTSFEVSFEEGADRCAYRWRGPGPEGWRSLTTAVAEAIEMLEAACAGG